MTAESVLTLAHFLSEHEFRSGESIAKALGCTRAAVWKQVGALRSLGVGVEAERGRGYRLVEPLELLDRERIISACGASAKRLAGLEVLTETDSTNAVVLGLPAGERHARVVFAECQTAGRGRRGRSWHSPFARNIYCSMGWRFDSGLRELSCLPLVVAMAASRALAQEGLSGHGIKWPNDLYYQGRKLGGCLVEVQGDVNGPCLAVMGVGLNVRMQGDTGAQAIDQPWTDIASQLPGVSRNALAGRLLGALVTNVATYKQRGFAPFLEGWRSMDVLEGQAVTLHRSGHAISGIARGIGTQGGLLLEINGRVEQLLAGEVTFRPTR